MLRIRAIVLSISCTILLHITFCTCPDGFECYEEFGSCYHFSNAKLSGHEASCMCGQYGAGLVKFDTAQEQRFIFDRVNPSNGIYYIGASDMKREGRFIWGDGTDVVHLDWAASQPNHNRINDPTSHCVIILRELLIFGYSERVYLAFDNPCHIQLRFICEKDIKGYIPGRYLKAVTFSQNAIYSDHVIATHPGTSLLECAHYCNRLCGRCWSMAYNLELSDCVLYDAYYSRLTGSTSTEPGYITYE